MRRAYEAWTPGEDARRDLARATQIVNEYRAQGYTLTLRQLYYQFVARDYIPNTDRSYKRLGSIVNRGRLAGLLDWSMIEDRTRNLEELSHWDAPGGVIAAAARSYHNDLWRTQPARVEIWVEKEALAGIVDQVASRWDCPWFSCRGYVSQSELWGAGQRLGRYLSEGQRVVVLHLGDHDPSGIDMTRDITDRLRTFITTDWAEDAQIDPLEEDDGTETVDTYQVMEEIAGQLRDPDAFSGEWAELVEVRRITLNRDQIDQYQPPPNPTKVTDSRAVGYIREFGRQCWELDALSPAVLDALIEQHIQGEVDRDAFEEAQGSQEVDRELLLEVSGRWSSVVQHIEGDE